MVKKKKRGEIENLCGFEQTVADLIPHRKEIRAAMSEGADILVHHGGGIHLLRGISKRGLLLSSQVEDGVFAEETNAAYGPICVVRIEKR